ncbi:Peptidase family M23 [Micromonospora pallida]|uniref:Peptidase family M23 n=1 Tax=Micromonospora pallida TaxID=145854 RepID=A0A1C6SBZ4_9ACTN|nr:M23 family metallopeptidase [Micromonospora pallida]SCL27004.1 Peptidase family M23 [Micromonospora pallida]
MATPDPGFDGASPALGRRELLLGTAAAVAGGVALGGLLQPGAARAAPVIYNPFGGYPISDDWQEHLARGSAGGIDFAMPVGTNLPACGAGTIQNIPYNGTGGHTVTINHADGYRSQYMHLSQFLLANGTTVTSGAIVGRSGGAAGAPGSGSSTGPHLHWHMIDPAGRRINPLTYVNPTNPTNPPFDIWRDTMKLIQSTNRGIALVGPGYFRQLNSDEEVHAAVALAGNPLVGNDRQFDLWRSIAFEGQVKAPS